MLLAYVIVMLILNMFMFVVWSGSNLLNVVIRLMFGLATVWSIVVLLQQLAPFINTGTMRLI